jgi:8-oxo-dGTP diphosphatase
MPASFLLKTIRIPRQRLFGEITMKPEHPLSSLLSRSPKLLDCLYIVNVEAAVYHEGRYLMIVRGMNEANAPGTLSFPGGKIEGARDEPDVVEATLRREIREETGLAVGPELVYVQSKAFTGSDGKPIVDLLFICRYASGEPAITAEAEGGEVAGLAWMTAEEILAHPKAPAWTRADLHSVEQMRQRLGW